jgi:MFS superfamily sulfate permease-like transporter
MHPINNNSTNTTTNDDALRVSIACSLTFLIGLFQVIMGFTGLGAISSYFSNTFISSYTTASAVHTFVSQMKDIFGLKNLKKYDGIFKIPRVSFI